MKDKDSKTHLIKINMLAFQKMPLTKRKATDWEIYRIVYLINTLIYIMNI